MSDMLNPCIKAKQAAIKSAASSEQVRNDALKAAAEALLTNKSQIFAANEADLERSRNENLAEPLIKRLKFDDKKLVTVVDGIMSLADMPDPINQTLLARELSPGLELYKVSCPIGVIGIIFESRPDALVQISSLCLKSGNAVLLKGGSEAMLTNKALYDVIYKATVEAGMPGGWMTLLETREEVSEMLKMDSYIDLVVPRGSNQFVKYIMDHSNIPVLGHAEGVCHVYVDESADINKAVPVCVDAKVQYVAVCNAMETLLVHEKTAPAFLPALKRAMEEANVRLLGCEKTRMHIDVQAATDADWDTEYLDYVLSVKVVGSVEEAMDHINTHGSRHTDSILSNNEQNIRKFVSGVDSAGVYVNCSTRFADGYVYGYGAEVGIGTGKIHSRGPVGMEGLLIYKYVLVGNGHKKGDFAPGELEFTHRDLDKDCPYL